MAKIGDLLLQLVGYNQDGRNYKKRLPPSTPTLTSRVWKHTASRVALAICALLVNWVNPMITLKKTQSSIRRRLNVWVFELHLLSQLNKRKRQKSWVRYTKPH